jgi:hypothetical protein
LIANPHPVPASPLPQVERPLSFGCVTNAALFNGCRKNNYPGFVRLFGYLFGHVKDASQTVISGIFPQKMREVRRMAHSVIVQQKRIIGVRFYCMNRDVMQDIEWNQIRR